MMLTRRRLVAGVGALAITAGTLLTTMAGASADTVTPGWEPDPNAIGSITFYNSSGNVITGGSLDTAPFAAYAVAGHAGRSGDNHADLYAFTPQEGGANPQTWSGDVLSASQYNPVPDGVPAAVTASGHPFVVGTAQDFSMSDYIGEYPNNLTDSGYADLYEIRLFTQGPGQEFNPAAYDRVDIEVNSGAGTWSVVYPGAAPTLDGKVTVSGTVRVGEKVTCHATFTGATSVSYRWLADSKAISGATKSTYTVAAAEYKKSLACRATGTNSGGSTPGTSTAKKVALGAALKATTKPKLSGPHKAGKTEKVSKGKWSPSASSYSYQWYANGKKIKHATKSSLKIPSSDKGKKLTCKVIAAQKGYANGGAKTAAVKVS
ncbi:MAG TPA: hypothetical protein VME70_13930 [Mycobacteriales bacterium]|nr:hypothetical protein [Mycobacteriales bacterium]